MSNKTKWEDDKLQFARLISEIQSVGGFDAELIHALAESMDLKITDIHELMERAEAVFEEEKSKL